MQLKDEMIAGSQDEKIINKARGALGGEAVYTSFLSAQQRQQQALLSLKDE
jgi:hypothetical protein